MNAHHKHDDCKFLATIDVAKGYCHRNKQVLIIDTPVCEKFDALPKCATCAKFVQDSAEANLGVCSAGPNSPWTYPDLIASTCEMYAGR